VLSVDPTGAPTATISEEPDAEPPTLPWRDEADPSGTGSQDNSAADAGGDGPPS
jgi:hypothetical protein